MNVENIINRYNRSCVTANVNFVTNDYCVVIKQLGYEKSFSPALILVGFISIIKLVFILGFLAIELIKSQFCLSN